MWDDKTIERIKTGQIAATGMITPEQLEAFRKAWEKSTLPRVRFVRTHPDAILPTRGTDGAVGWDVYAVEQAFVYDQPVLVKTGWKIAVPDGYEVQVRPRSGLALKQGITVLNTPGTIDPDYRGDLGVILVGTAPSGRLIHKGDRIAQLVVAPVTRAAMVEVQAFDDTTERGEGGYGSTGS